MNPDHFWILLTAIGTAIIAIGGLFGWLIRTIVPKVLESFDKRNVSMSSFIERTCTAVEKISESIRSFERSIVGMEIKLSEKHDRHSGEIKVHIESAKDEMLEEIRDVKFKQLAEKIEKGPASRSHPSFSGIERDGSSCNS